MKLSFLISLGLVGICHAFSVLPAGAPVDASATRLHAFTGRRDMLADMVIAAASVSAGAVLTVPTAALAADYVPQFKDMKQIYQLGEGLDRLLAKLKEPDQTEVVLAGVKQFNKDPNFYTGYAKNFIMKSVKKGSDSDPRVGYVKQASTLIGSLESVLGGGDALMNEKSTSEEAVKRIKKAQALVVKFLEECGVEDEQVKSFIASHK